MGSTVDNVDCSVSVPSSGKVNAGVSSADIFTLPMARHRLNGARAASGHPYGPGHKIFALRGSASSPEYLFYRASPAWRTPHLCLPHNLRSP